MARFSGRVKILLLGLVFVFATKAIWDTYNRPMGSRKTPDELIADARAERAYRSAVLRMRALKASIKNPDSFQLVEARVLPWGPLCVTYRGTNSFNAIVLEQKAIEEDLSFSDWNNDCGGKNGQDVTRARDEL